MIRKGWQKCKRLDAEGGREASGITEERAPMISGCYPHSFTQDHLALEANTNLLKSMVTEDSPVMPITKLFRGSLFMYEKGGDVNHLEKD